MANQKFIEQLRAAFSKPLPGWEAQKQLMPEGRELEFPSENLHPASVLIALYLHQGEWAFPLIQRSIDGFVHSGQIALPGGRREGDENHVETALREAHEEVNIIPASVEILGKTSLLPIPVSNHIVQPIVGHISSEPQFKPDPREVAKIFSFSIRTLVEQETQFETRHFKNRDWEIPFFEVEGHKVWGATAMILSEFREILSRLE